MHAKQEYFPSAPSLDLSIVIAVYNEEAILAEVRVACRRFQLRDYHRR
jgi:hypothetical protein